MPVWLLIVIAVLLVIACAVFVAAEFALITVDRARVEQSAAEGDRRSAGVLKALTSLSTQLSGAQLGITITNLAIGFLAEPAIADLLQGPLTALGLPSSAVPGIALTVALVLATAVTMVFGELVPKNLAIADPWRTARAVSGAQRAFTMATSVVIRLLNGTANATVRALGVEPTEELASARSTEELAALVRHSAAQGALDRGTADLLTRSLAFGDRIARDVLTPRTRVRWVPDTATVADVLHASRASGHSRFPVTGPNGLDEVRGVVHVKHAIAIPRSERDHVPVSAIARPPVLVPDTLELDPLLDQLRAEGLQLAVVLDEYGGAAGIVTMEDLVEEIVGEVADEHDRLEVQARRLPDGSWVLSALLRPDEAQAITGLAVPDEDDIETLAGLVAERLSRVPQVGDTVDAGAVRLTVVRMDGRRVDRVRVAHRTDEVR